MKYLLIFFVGAIAAPVCFAQSSDCKVLTPALEGAYQGDCKKGKADGDGRAKGTDEYEGSFKKGLPHGVGTYTWNNGNSYEGNWKNGKKEGKGKLFLQRKNGGDSTVVGFWSKDKYVGEYKNPYKVHNKGPLVTGVRLSKISDVESYLELEFNSKGAAVANPEFVVTTIRGNFTGQQSFNRSAKVFDITFPFRAIITHNGEAVEFEIFQKGAWKMVVDMNK
ncbi:hypothetical protein QQ020_04915 [Fulvivirgaceae bacterium BMA12]|uniref:MORN repeat-containing protein n=1 Tax=Agaribacillus aureus TaxID=3051825 RepID=A0ABT8L0W3_9BACT|nr:hypothetical protein [Fulvivirgaceae bacterium BMA12]